MDATKLNAAITDLPDSALHPRVPSDNHGNTKPVYKRSQMTVTEVVCHSGDNFAVGKTAEGLLVAFFGGNAYAAKDRAELNGVLNHVERSLLPAE